MDSPSILLVGSMRLSSSFLSCVSYSVQHYVIQFVSDLQPVRGISPGTPVSSTNKTDHHNIAEILLKVALNIITLTSSPPHPPPPPPPAPRPPTQQPTYYKRLDRLFSTYLTISMKPITEAGLSVYNIIILEMMSRDLHHQTNCWSTITSYWVHHYKDWVVIER
jgi:hypothetical protein